MGKLQDVTRFLLAAGGSASADGKSTHLFHEENNKLFMETWTGSEISNRQQVVTGVRTDTSAPLVSLHYNVSLCTQGPQPLTLLHQRLTKYTTQIKEDLCCGPNTHPQMLHRDQESRG